MKKWLIWLSVGFVTLNLCNLYIFTLVFFYQHATSPWQLITLDSSIGIVFGFIISAIVLITKDILEDGW